MSVHLRKMTNTEFDVFYEWSVSSQMKDYMEIHGLSFESAWHQAMEEFQNMLPDGLSTLNHNLMTIVLSDTKEVAGFIWTLQEEFVGKRQIFLCDFVIFESYRRKGYATDVLAIMHRYAMEAGCEEIVLFVSDHNIAAQNLYFQCGYLFLRKCDHGQYLVKSLY